MRPEEHSLTPLDIEGFELDFLRMRKPKADIIVIEVVQWARAMEDLMTAVELLAYLADIGYYFYMNRRTSKLVVPVK